jgi:hypothetical protein
MKTKNLLLVLIFFFTLFSTFIHNPISAEDKPIYFQETEHFYLVVNGSTIGTWWQAKSYAESTTYLGKKGHLVTISSAVEDSFVKQYALNGRSCCYWLGGYQPAGSSEPNSGWRWVTNEPMVYTNWMQYEPNNNEWEDHYGYPPEDYIQGESQGWNDVSVGVPGSGSTFVIEYDTKRQLSGGYWCDRFPGSTKVGALDSRFRPKVQNFLSALTKAKINYTITATKRPEQRAYLMHYAWRIWKGRIDPRFVEFREDVLINWAHKDASGNFDLAKSNLAAEEMVDGYGIRALEVPPALNSTHVRGLAIDLKISWTASEENPIYLKYADGKTVKLTTSKNVSSVPPMILRKVGESYGVIHTLGAKDPVHWSVNGN